MKWGEGEVRSSVDVRAVQEVAQDQAQDQRENTPVPF